MKTKFYDAGTPVDQPRLDDSELFKLMGDPMARPSALVDVDQDVWIKATGLTPLEFLTWCYRNGLCEMRDRISAAKACLEYAHIPLTKGIRLETGDGTFDATKLSDEELAEFNTLLERMRDAPRLK